MSHAMFPTEVVIKVSERYLALRKEYLQTKENQDIERRVKESTPGFLGRLFGCKQMTLEEARQDYEGSLCQEMIQIQGKHWAIQAKEVLMLAKKAAENGVATVALSADVVTAFEKMGAFQEA